MYKCSFDLVFPRVSFNGRRRSWTGSAGPVRHCTRSWSIPILGWLKNDIVVRLPSTVQPLTICTLDIYHRDPHSLLSDFLSIESTLVLLLLLVLLCRKTLVLDSLPTVVMRLLQSRPQVLCSVCNSSPKPIIPLMFLTVVLWLSQSSKQGLFAICTPIWGRRGWNT